MRLKMQALIKWMLWYLTNNTSLRLFTLSSIVIGLHCAILIQLGSNDPPPIRMARKQIAVSTTILKKPHIIQKTIARTKPKAVAGKVKPKVVARKVKPQKKKVVPTKTHIKKKIPVKKKAATKAVATPKPAPIPQAVTPKSLEKPKEEVKQVYMQGLLGLIAESFELPEIGAVLAKLTISKEGVLKKCIIVKSESVKNSAYIENHLRQLELPPFNGDLQQASEETFEITFRNKL